MATIDLKTLLGMAIKTQRASLGISQEELAHRAGLHRTYVSDLERGVRNPSIESIEKLAGALQISVSKLFESVENGGGSHQMVEILLVQDNPRDVDLTVSAFEKANITNPLNVARDGEQAFDLAFANASRDKLRRTLLILLDLNLPKGSGLEFLRRIRADKQTQNIPVIILTLSTRDRDIAQYLNLGAEDYIVKPLDFQNFCEVTARLGWVWTLANNRSEMEATTKRR
jgi:CheY-like chemotaxis protein/DNA-binding XRE family transcriptional regulator